MNVDEDDVETKDVDEGTGGIDEGAEAEEKARKLGWAPKDEWRGAETDWLPAEQFLTRIALSRAVMEERFDKLERTQAEKVGELERKLDETTKVLGEVHAVNKTIAKRFTDADTDALRRHRNRIKAKMEAAVDESDKPGYQAAEAELEALDLEEATRNEAAKPKVETREEPEKKPERIPEVDAWVAKNEWFSTGKQWVKDAANGLHLKLMDEKAGLSLADNLEEVTKEMRSRYPELFENQRRQVPGTAAKPTGDRQVTRRAKSLADLPPDARDAYQRLKKQFKTARNIDYTPEEYINDYNIQPGV